MIAGPFPTVWMYHYVRPEGGRLPHRPRVTPDRFRAHLDHVQSTSTVLGPEEFVHGIEHGTWPTRAALLTFDDGLLDHFEWVYPELRERGLRGVFFLIGEVLVGRGIPVSHQLHVLAGRGGYPDFMAAFMREASRHGSPVPSARFRHPHSRSAYPYDSPEVAGFKFAITYILSKNFVDSIVRALFEQDPEAVADASRLFMSTDQIAAMAQDGQAFGTHGFSHRAWATLDEPALGEELDSSTELVQQITGSCFEVACCPYGDRGSVNRGSIKVAREKGFSGIFMAEQLSGQDQYLIPRLDCKELENAVDVG